MAQRYSHLQLLLLIFSFFIHLSHSLKLQPIISTSTSHVAGELHTNSFAPRNSESFLWGGPTGESVTFTKLTLYTPDDETNIINLERLQDLTTSIQCSNDTITLQFNDTSAYAQLHDQWSWTNQEENNTLILVAGAGQCDWNEDRQPFTISSITYNNGSTTAVLSGSRVQWGDVASNYDLHVGTLPQTELSRRDHTRNYNFPFNHQLGFGNWTFPTDPTLSAGLACKSCYTTGNFTFDFDVKTKIGIPVDMTVTMGSQNVSVVLDPTFSLSGNIGSSQSFKDTFLRIPLDGITVADIIDLGPNIAFTGSLNIGPLNGTASVTAGVTISVEDSAEMYLDLLHPSKSKAPKWTTHISGDSPSVSASIGAEISLGLLADVEFDVTLLGKGLSAGIGLQPLLGATLSAVDSPSGACASDPKHNEFGVELAPSAGVELLASVSGVTTVTIASKTISLPTDCLGIGSPATTSLPVVTSSTSATVTSVVTTLPLSSSRPPSQTSSRPPSQTSSRPPSQTSSRPSSQTVSWPPSQTASRPPSQPSPRPSSQTASWPPSQPSPRPSSQTASWPPSQTASRPPSQTLSRLPSQTASRTPSHTPSMRPVPKKY